MLAAEWIRENIEIDASVLSGYTLFRSMYFDTGGRYHFYVLPTNGLSIYPFGVTPRVSTKREVTSGPVLFVWNHLRSRNFSTWDAEPGMYWNVLYEKDLFEAIRTTGARHLVLEERTWFIRDYLDKHPQFERVAEIASKIWVYRVRGEPKPMQFAVRLGDEIPILLTKVQRESVPAFEFVIESVCEKLLRLTEEDCRRLTSGRDSSEMVFLPRGPDSKLRTRGPS